MGTPPVTRTKDDANKELHEIELKINDKKKDLEVISKKKTDAEEGFVAREKRCDDRERESKIKLSNITDKIPDAEEEVEELRVKIVDNNSSITNQNKIISDNDTEIKEQKSHLEQLATDTEIDEKARYEIADKICETIKRRYEELTSVEALVVAAESKLKGTKKKEKELDATIEKKNADLTKRERAIENGKSNLRVWAVRLNKKYGDVATEPEINRIKKLE